MPRRIARQENPVTIGQAIVDPITLETLLDHCDESLATGEQQVLLCVNAQAVVLAEHNAAFRDALRQADWVFCDGMGVWLAARWLRTPLPARFTPTDWIEQLCQLCAKHNRSIFLLGGIQKSVLGAAENLRQRVQGLVVHTHRGHFELQGPENEAVVAQINAAQPGVLLVGFGMPLQELWITENRGRLNAKVILAVGGLFDYLSGIQRRGPRWLTDRGLEWLYRLISHPRRLWRRYLLGLPRFGWIVLRQKIGQQR